MGMIESRDRATSDPEARKAVLKQIEKEGVDYLLLWFTDIEGHLKSFAITLERGRGRAGRRHGLRRLVGHRLQRDRGVGHGRDPRSGDVPADAVARGRGEGRPHDLRRRQARRRPVRGRPALRAAPRARADGVDGLRHVQHRPRARVLPLQEQQGHGDARRGRLLRDDRARRRDRAALRDDQGARGRRASRSSTTTTRWRRRSTRSTCASPRRSTWPTTRSRTG